jgi:hypothetical protein
MADIQKYTLSQWARHPTTIILAIAVNVVWILIFIVTDMASDKSKECIEQVMYLRGRVEKLEQQQDAYTRAILYRDLRIKELVDSLSGKNGMR